MNLTFSINMFGFHSKFSADLAAAAATALCSFVPNRLPRHRNECDTKKEEQIQISLYDFISLLKNRTSPFFACVK